VWVNGHEWAKRQATKAGIAFTAFDNGRGNGFASCADPAGLQEICDRLGPATITVFLERWWARLPLPLTAADRTGGYWWDTSMRQVEVSRTLVFGQGSVTSEVCPVLLGGGVAGAGSCVCVWRLVGRRRCWLCRRAGVRW
jgi:hypothetical protein